MNTINPVLPLTATNTSIPSQQDQRIVVQRDMAVAFDNLHHQITNLKPNIKATFKQRDVSLFLQKQMKRIYAALYPPVPLIKYMAPVVFESAFIPFCHLQDVLTMASTCKTYYDVVKKPLFWAKRLQREIPYPIFPTPKTVTSAHYSLHIKALSKLGEIIQLPPLHFAKATLHTKNVAGNIVILLAGKEIRLLDKNQHYRLVDFPPPPPPPNTKSSTLNSWYIPRLDTITRVSAQKEGRFNRGKGSMLCTVEQWDYMKAIMVTAFRTVIPNVPKYLLEKNVKANLQISNNSNIIFSLFNDDNIHEISIDINSKKIKLENQRFLRTYLQSSKGYIEHNHIEKSYTLHRENSSSLYLNSRDENFDDVNTALSPDETRFVILRSQEGKWNLILWNLTDGTARGCPDIIPVPSAGEAYYRIMYGLKKANLDFLSPHVLTITVAKYFHIVSLGPVINKFLLPLRREGQHASNEFVKSMATDPYGLFMLNAQNGGKGEYYSLIPNRSSPPNKVRK